MSQSDSHDDELPSDSPENVVEPHEAIETEGGDGSSESPTAARPEPTVWLAPAIVIVALTWFLLIVPGKLYPLTLIHFISMQGGPPLAALAMMIWWLASRRVPWRQRILGLVVIIGITMVSMFAGHKSMAIVMLIYGLPVAMTLLVLSLVLTRSRPWRQRIGIATAAFAVVMLGSLAFRIEEMDAAFAFNLVSRGKPTAEEILLKEIEQSDPAAGATELSQELPMQPGPNDWPGFRGKNRDGVLHGVTFATDWETNPPRELWRRKVGPAWSSFCVIGPVCYTQEQRGEEEIVSAYRVEDGEPIWTATNKARFEASMGGVGPRATPTYHQRKLYTVGAAGLIQCLDAQTGQQLWSYDLQTERKKPVAMWGFSSSALVHENVVIVYEGDGKGRGLIALHENSGKVAWRSGDGDHAYGSPQLGTLHGVEQILLSNNRGLRGFLGETGEGLWSYDWDVGQMARITQPLVVGDSVFLSTGYGNGTRRVEVQFDDGRWNTLGSEWTAPLKPYFNDCVYQDGHLYGFDGAIFMSLDGETGEKNWKRGRYGHGQVLLIADMKVLLVISEDGELILLDADPEGHHELAKMEAFEKGVTWNHPVIADGRLFVRNDQEAVCYELPQ